MVAAARKRDVGDSLAAAWWWQRQRWWWWWQCEARRWCTAQRGSAVAAARRLRQTAALLAALALIPTCAKRLSSFVFVGAAVVAVASSGNMGGSDGNSDMEEMNACTTISLKKSDGGNDCNEESWQRGRGRRRHEGRRR